MVNRSIVKASQFKLPLFYLILVPQCKSSNAGNSDRPKGSRKVLLLREKVGMYREKHSGHIGLSTSHGLRHPLGSENVTTADQGQLLYDPRRQTVDLLGCINV